MASQAAADKLLCTLSPVPLLFDNNLRPKSHNWEAVMQRILDRIEKLSMSSSEGGLHEDIEKWYENLAELSKLDPTYWKIVNLAPRGFLVPAALEAIKGYSEGLEQPAIDGKEDEQAEMEFLKTLWKLFDALIFEGAMSHNGFKLKYAASNSTLWKLHNKNPAGQTKLGRTKGKHLQSPENGYCVEIIIFENIDDEFAKNHAQKMRRMAGTLLHEMVHGFYMMYCCLCNSCRYDVSLPFGLTGHGFAWAALLAALGSFSAKFLGFNLKTGLVDGLANEYLDNRELLVWDGGEIVKKKDTDFYLQRYLEWQKEFAEKTGWELGDVETWRKAVVEEAEERGLL